VALDTAEKRRSVSGVALWLPGVSPDSDQAAAWRQQVAWLYSGIAAATVEAVVGIEVIVPARRREFTVDARDTSVEVPARRRQFTVPDREAA